MAGLAVETTKRILFEYGPDILKEQYFERYQEKPGYMDRLQSSAGPHKSGKDPHIAGRALDIILRANMPNELEVGNELVDVFLECREEMQWAAVIYNHSEWNGQGMQMPRKRNARTKEGKVLNIDDAIFGHITHIHIEWSGANLSSTGFEDALVNALCGGGGETNYESKRLIYR